MTRIDSCVAWLKGLDCTDVRKLRITIGKTLYDAAEYVQDNRKRIYVLGELPKAYLRSSHTCFRLPNSEVDHYIACYMSGARLKEFPQYADSHQWGANFIIMQWDLPEAIDQYERRPYARIEMVISKA